MQLLFFRLKGFACAISSIFKILRYFLFYKPYAIAAALISGLFIFAFYFLLYTMSTIFPICSPDSSNRCASAASASGSAR